MQLEEATTTDRNLWERAFIDLHYAEVAMERYHCHYYARDHLSQ